MLWNISNKHLKKQIEKLIKWTYRELIISCKIHNIVWWTYESYTSMPMDTVCGGYLTTHSAFGRGKERDVSVATITIMVL